MTPTAAFEHEVSLGHHGDGERVTAAPMFRVKVKGTV